MALVVVGIVAVALLTAHGLSSRADARVRILEDQCLVAQHAFADAALGRLTVGSETNYGNWRARVSEVATEGRAGAVIWKEIRLDSGGEGGSTAVVYLLDRESANRPLRP